MKKPPYRLWIGIMIFMSTFQNYMLRSNMSVSIISMVERKGSQLIPPCKRDGVNVTDDKNTTTNATSKSTESEKFPWTENQVGDIMSAYFWGYIITSVPAGILSELLGPWHVIFWSTIGATALTGLTPLSTKLGAVGVVVNRVLIGMFGGVVYPAITVLMAKWAPPKEKGKFMAAMMGNTLGTVVSFNLVGWATDEFGWEWGFYVLVIFVSFYLIAFFFIVSDTPEKCRWVSEEERTYIFESQEGAVSKKKAVAPYLKILISIPFWALCLAQFGNLWGLNLILTYAPKFMAETLGFNIKASAGLAALPYLARLICSNIFGLIGDAIRRRDLMGVTKMRKFFVLFSHFLPAACLFLIRAAGCNHVGVVFLLVLNQGLNGAVVVAHLVNSQDLSPNFTGTLYGIMNFIGMTTGMFVPKITGALNTYYNSELMAATLIYTIGGVAMGACGLLFVIFGTAKVQPWNEIKEKAPTTEEPTTTTTTPV